MTREPLRDSWRSTEFVSGCCLMLPAALYESLGGFDERFFMYVEDLDLCIRARSLGVQIIVVNSSLLHEVGSGQAGQYSNVYLYENTKNRLICLRQHRLGWPGIRIAYFVAKYGAARALQLALFSSKPMEQIGAAWRGLWDGYFHMPECRLADFQKAACGGGLK
jgi:GT2 family glycosyltransferase